MTDAAPSTRGLSRLEKAMADHVDAGQLPGLVALVASGSGVEVLTVGSPSFGATTPMDRAALFRIASLSKPITAAATMTLVDEGRLRLDQPVDDLLPELAEPRVLRALDSELDDTVPARRSITVEDLLTSRLGLGSIMAPPGRYPIQRAEATLGLQSIGGPPWPPVRYDVDGWMAALGTLPLVYQPGEQWLYNTSIQVLGVLLARAAGADLETVLRTRILEPLGMIDTGFTVPPDRLGRLTTAYSSDPQTNEISVLDEPSTSWWRTPPSFPDASGWLVSTIDDYWKFVSMLLAGGRHGATQVLSGEAVALMTTDKLSSAQRGASKIFLGVHGSWGFGMAVPVTGSTDPLPCGFGWDGGTGCTWRSNPRSGVTGILLTQRAVNSPEPTALVNDFWTGVNAATIAN